MSVCEWLGDGRCSCGRYNGLLGIAWLNGQTYQLEIRPRLPIGDCIHRDELPHAECTGWTCSRKVNSICVVDVALLATDRWRLVLSKRTTACLSSSSTCNPSPPLEGSVPASTGTCTRRTQVESARLLLLFGRSQVCSWRFGPWLTLLSLSLAYSCPSTHVETTQAAILCTTPLPRDWPGDLSVCPTRTARALESELVLNDHPSVSR